MHKKERILFLGVGIVLLLLCAHGLYAQCSCANQNFYGSCKVSGPRMVACAGCPGGTTYIQSCTSTTQCSSSFYCEGGCGAGCYCFACSTKCTSPPSCPCIICG